ncbi:MAG: hypothetical protein C0469_16910 [Cyanobacteria bacterium DS2.3.42]|nr:hypothetical protein [Cyanobacteria bacterium DS2.3.42]
MRRFYLASRMLLAMCILLFLNIAAKSETDVRVPLNPFKLETELLESPAQRKFDSKAWIASVELRRYMLLDLFRSGMFNKSREDVHALLGKPLRTAIKLDARRDYFDLGKHDGEKLALQAIYDKNRLWSFLIDQCAEGGYLHLVAGDWRWKNPEILDAAKEFNRVKYLVGAPRQHLCQFVGHPQQEGRSWKCGCIEVEFSPDMSKVRRFRFTPDRFGVIKTTTGWEDQDLRVISGSYSTGFDWQYLERNVDSVLAQPCMKFDQANWTQVSHRGSMMFDLLHSFPLIGKSRLEIQHKLGEPYYNETKGFLGRRSTYLERRRAEKEPFNKFDWFALCRTGCILPAEPSQYLEVVYQGNFLQGDAAVGYRIVQTDTYRDGEKDFAEFAFSEREGFCQPIKCKTQKAL